MAPSSSPQMLEVGLDYYPGHEKLLQAGAYARLGTAAKVKAYRAHGHVALGDFLNYLLIHRADNSLYATYAARDRRLHQASDWIENVITTDGTVNCHSGSKRLQEVVGEALSLSVIGSLFNLTAADWKTVPIKKIKTFDFERTITGVTAKNEVIQIEAKCCFLKDNQHPSNADQSKLSSHAAKIADKKVHIKAAGATYPFPASARYGVIAAVDEHQSAKCYLLDPPADRLDSDPHRDKIANRLQHLAFVISLLAPRATLSTALMSRAAVWRQLGGPEPTGSLRTTLGHSFTAGNYVEDFLANGKIWVKELDIVGYLYEDSERRPLFVGVHGDVVRTAIRQDIDEILDQRFKPNTYLVNLKGQPRQLGDRLHDYRMALHAASSGVVVGLPPHE